MNPTGIKLWTLIGWLVAGAAALSIFLTFIKVGEDLPSDDDSAGPSPKTRLQGLSRTHDVHLTKRTRARVPESVIDKVASQRLVDHFQGEEYEAILDDLTSLSETHSLAAVSQVLKGWCRTGPLELAQWSLAFSQKSDPELNLSLCVEALSNPSDIIREIAAAQLEAVSEIPFANSTEARSWLRARPKH